MRAAESKSQGEVVFDDVSFGYVPDVPVLKHVSLRAEPGQMVALVGPTGAGKTTIVNLLTRFYDVDSGSHHHRRAWTFGELKKDDLRRQLGIVLQDTFLFSGTVMDNIRYGRLDATDEEVYRRGQAVPTPTRSSIGCRRAMTRRSPSAPAT